MVDYIAYLSNTVYKLICKKMLLGVITIIALFFLSCLCLLYFSLIFLYLAVTKRVEEWVLNAPIIGSQSILGSFGWTKTVMTAETRRFDFENGHSV